MTKPARITQATIVRAVKAARAIDPAQTVEIVMPDGVVLRYPTIDPNAKASDKTPEPWE